MPDLSWGEVALIAVLLLALFGTGSVARFVRGLRRGLREEDPGIRVTFVEPGANASPRSRAPERPWGNS